MLLVYFLGSLMILSGICTAGASSRDSMDEPGGSLSVLVFLSLFFVLWAASVWFLALLQCMIVPGFLGLATALNLLSIGLLWKRRASWRLVRMETWRRSLQPVPVVAVVALGILFAYNLFKGYILPCANTDANAWSMPIAVYYLKHQGLDLFTGPQAEWREHLADPSNYELIVASILSLDGTDRITEWVSTVCAGGILAAAWSLFRRWHGEGMHVWIGVLVVASAPVFLLHMAADKADLLASLLTVLATFWVARAWAGGGRQAFLLALYTGVMLVGTKKTGWIIAPILFTALGWCLVHRIRHREASLRSLLRWVPAHVALAFLLLGGMRFIYLIIHAQPKHGWLAMAGFPGRNLQGFSLWDPLRFLWHVSWHPFRSGTYDFRLPFSPEAWYWPGFNLIYSHFGWVFGPLLAVMLGLVVWVRYRKDWRGWFSQELTIFAILSGLAFWGLFIRRYAYEGSYNTYPRFTLFILIPLLALGLVPLLARLGRSKSGVLFPMVATALLNLGWTASVSYAGDQCAPHRYLLDLWANPEKRRWVFVGPNRIPCRLDRLAGPTDVIATDCTYQTWLYPLWGEKLTRDVRLVRWREGRAEIPREATWAVADNVSGITWGGGRTIRDAGDFLKAWNQGMPSQRDSLLYRQLIADPEWACLFATPTGEQCVFRRRK